MRVRSRRLAIGSLLIPGLVGSAVVAAPAPAFAGVAATVQAPSTLALRSGPARTYPVRGTLPNHARVTIVCKVTGEYVAGNTRTRQWDRLNNGWYVTHAFIATSEVIPACPVQPPASEPTGTMTQTEFIAAAARPAQASQRRYRVPASVTIAQAILESGWGRSGLAATDKNYFGVKCFEKGPYATGCHTYATSECRKDGSCYRTKASFRVYATVQDSFLDHGLFLASSARYRAAFSYPRDPNRFIVEVHRAGYATSPTYAADIQRLITRYQLRRYDLK